MVHDHEIDEFDLLAFADGLLDADTARKAGVEQRLLSRPENVARVQAYRAQAEALRRAFDKHLLEPVPDRLLNVLTTRPERRNRRMARAAALVLAIAVASTSGWLIGRSDHETQWSSQIFLQQSYKQYVDSAVGAQVEPAGSFEPLGWLSEEVSLTLRLPDIAHLGYRVVDKRTVNDGRYQLVRIVYAATDGRSFSLFLRPRWDERRHQLQIQTERDVSLAYWMDGPVASAIASTLPPAEIKVIAEAIRGVLLDRKATRPTMNSAPTSPVGQGDEVASGVPPADKVVIPEDVQPLPLPSADTPG
jgi:anti-sigma factor RsiW